MLLAIVTISPSSLAQDIPLPEHPRPDFARDQWENLNGQWNFRFDSQDEGVNAKWFQDAAFDQKIIVPFPWGSKLSELEDEADIGWYHRMIRVDPSWEGKRTFLIIGASDWKTTVWLDGQLLGDHEGGYVPFEFDLTPHLKYGVDQDLVIRVDDVRRDFTLYGKQGYGNARGIWQTTYLEARGTQFIDAAHFSPDIQAESAIAKIYADLPVKADQQVQIQVKDESGNIFKGKGLIAAGESSTEIQIEIPEPKLWNLETPHLYEAEVTMGDDIINTYFGMREISVVDLPGTDYPYIALNGKPIYLQLALDQSYHPDGFYTFPSDEFMRREIELSKSIGLNGIRPHIKVEIPRKLYWADKLGLLVMADLPNSWGEPDRPMQKETEYTLRQMIKRSYNHPSIFSWILFNETWGLRTKVQEGDQDVNRYLPATQNWVASMYYLAKSLDPTRLIEDNSICCGAGHTETDINSFHDYKAGYEWIDHLRDLTERSHPGSPFQFEAGFLQGNQPKINSECGNVWGYAGSTGDVDWSYDYHRMINAFRIYPEIAGWLYTEHHDVINEWNGYWRFDRSEKFTGMEDMYPGMSLNDLHTPIYLSTDIDICTSQEAGSEVRVPLFLSSMTEALNAKYLKINFIFEHTEATGKSIKIKEWSEEVRYNPYMQEWIDPIKVTMPSTDGLAILKMQIEAEEGEILHHNFLHFEVVNGVDPEKLIIISKNADDISQGKWTKKQWSILDGKKNQWCRIRFF